MTESAQKLSQEIILLNYLQQAGKSITTKDAFKKLGIIDLQSVVRNLRKTENIEDEWIKCKNDFGKMTRYKKYWLGEGNK